MDDQEFYYDVSYQRTKEGPVGAMRRSKLEDVAEWLKNDTAGLHFIIILRMPGSPEGLPDREVQRMEQCSFCSALETHKLVSNAEENVSRRYRAALLTLLFFCGDRRGRSVDYIQDGDGCPLNFCPECGKKLEGTEEF